MHVVRTNTAVLSGVDGEQFRLDHRHIDTFEKKTQKDEEDKTINESNTCPCETENDEALSEFTGCEIEEGAVSDPSNGIAAGKVETVLVMDEPGLVMNTAASTGVVKDAKLLKSTFPSNTMVRGISGKVTKIEREGV
ncbi:unnamed protein product [Ambrosiozyma monospora]|uniref:Unnamed protein product n=1 Tax=Ambrosiozyma monospora TaxID=43982 RepID=A0ACB5TZ84_AMBMO|nr:unnamed protein product [Ambrosiozyma monospora]